MLTARRRTVPRWRRVSVRRETLMWRGDETRRKEEAALENMCCLEKNQPKCLNNKEE
jgi:hypothetical protein